MSLCACIMHPPALSILHEQHVSSIVAVQQLLILYRQCDRRILVSWWPHAVGFQWKTRYECGSQLLGFPGMGVAYDGGVLVFTWGGRALLGLPNSLHSSMSQVFMVPEDVGSGRFVSV